MTAEGHTVHVYCVCVWVPKRANCWVQGRKLTPCWGVTCNCPIEDAKGWQLKFHDLAARLSLLGVHFLFNTSRLVTQKGSNLSIKHRVQRQWHICSFIVMKVILMNGCDTITLKAFCQSSSQLTFLSSPPFVRSSASVALTLIQMPSAHCFHWKLVRFHAYSSEQNKYVSVSLCSSR